MKRIKKLMATIMALTLVFGCCNMTAFAAEENVTGMGTKSIDINVGYTAPTDPADNDAIDGVYNIQIEYDNLDFQYTTESIKWDAENSKYIVTTNPDPNPSRGIRITNKSTADKEISVTPSLVSATPKAGVNYEMQLKRGDDVITTLSNSGIEDSGQNKTAYMGGAWGQQEDQLTVNITKMEFGPKVQSFESTTFATISLTFADAPHSGGSIN